MGTDLGILKELNDSKIQKLSLFTKPAESKAYWEMVEREYKNCGCENGWGGKIPELVKTARKDKDAKWFVKNEGRCYNKYICDKYKIYYTVDSSD